VAKMLLAGALLAMSASVGIQESAPKYLDPVGTWTFSTKGETGDPVTGTVEISGQPGQYAGKIVTAEGREVKIVDILTGPKSIVIVAELPEGGAAVIRGILDASGKLTGTWGPVRPAIPVMLERKQ
jgi:hypothetical protein